MNLSLCLSFLPAFSFFLISLQQPLICCFNSLCELPVLAGFIVFYGSRQKYDRALNNLLSSHNSFIGSIDLIESLVDCYFGRQNKGTSVTPS